MLTKLCYHKIVDNYTKILQNLWINSTFKDNFYSIEYYVNVAIVSTVKWITIFYSQIKFILQRNVYVYIYNCRMYIFQHWIIKWAMKSTMQKIYTYNAILFHRWTVFGYVD